MKLKVPPTNPNAVSIHQRAISRAKRYRVAEGELLESIMEVDRVRAFELYSITHLTPYCVQVLGLSEEVAACFVRVARKSRSVPALKEAVVCGKLPLTKAKAISSIITKENQREWIDWASTLSKEKLERKIAEHFPGERKPERVRPVGLNRYRVEFDLTKEEMALFQRARNLICQKKKKFVSLAETQREILEYYLEKQDPVRKADRSRERPSAAASLVHAINKRDRGKCQAKMPDGSICGASRWVHFHHIKPKSEGGEDTAQNMITLCSAHHRQWHRSQAPPC